TDFQVLGRHPQFTPDAALSMTCFYQCGGPNASHTSAAGLTSWTELVFTVTNLGGSDQEEASHVSLFGDLSGPPTPASTPLVVEDIPPLHAGQSVTRRTRLPGGTFQIPPDSPPHLYSFEFFPPAPHTVWALADASGGTASAGRTLHSAGGGTTFAHRPPP